MHEGDELRRRPTVLNDLERVRAQLKRSILSEDVPSGLQERIQSDIRRSPRSKPLLRTSWLIAAAVVVLGLVVGVLLRSSSKPSAEQSLLFAEVAQGDQKTETLKVAFDGHISCAVDHGMANKQFTPKQMSEKLGPQYEGLVALVKDRTREYDVMVGHRCHYQGREFVHLILRKAEGVVSLIITHKSGNDFPAINTAVVQIYESSWDTIHVAGAQTRDYLTFVVSNESKPVNEQIASRLMPAVRDFLKSKEA